MTMTIPRSSSSCPLGRADRRRHYCSEGGRSGSRCARARSAFAVKICVLRKALTKEESLRRTQKRRGSARYWRRKRRRRMTARGELELWQWRKQMSLLRLQLHSQTTKWVQKRRVRKQCAAGGLAARLHPPPRRRMDQRRAESDPLWGRQRAIPPSASLLVLYGYNMGDRNKFPSCCGVKVQLF